MTLCESIKDFAKDADEKQMAHFIVFVKNMLPLCPPPTNTPSNCTYGERNKETIEETGQAHSCEQCWELVMRGEADCSMRDMLDSISESVRIGQHICVAVAEEGGNEP